MKIVAPEPRLFITFEGKVVTLVLYDCSCQTSSILFTHVLVGEGPMKQKLYK